MTDELIPDDVKPLALQAVIYFVLANINDEPRSEETQRFINSPMCKAFGDKLTFGNVCGLAEAGGYKD